ncbi:MAG: adenylate/guanylate cyclase domain-containing protein, partial [Desulfobacterales bacterium]|nr:adenylate/guanylate cyclase domain-containing protein [Desulfobacterales bacterium]
PSGYTSNLSQLQMSARSGGFFGHPLFDLDGVFRKIPIIQEYEGKVYEALSLAMIRVILESPPLELEVTTEKGESATMGLEWLKIGGLRIPVDEQGAVLIPYRGPQGSFSYVSAVDVLTKTADPETLRGAIVIVGTTTTGLKDLYTTPVQSIFPGVEIHANLISGFLDQTIKHKPGYTLGIEFVLLLIIGLLMSLSLPRMSPLWSLVTTVAILMASVWLNFYMWTQGGLFVPLVSSLFLILMLFIVHMSSGFFIEASGKKQIASLFEQYVPPELVDEMSKNPSDYGMSGESREMTVFFADIRSFTSTSENADPKQMTLLINTVFTFMTEIIYKHRGTIDKYMGDAIMAFWGAPLEDPDHAQHALNAALEMIESIPKLRKNFKKQGLPVIDFGISLNTGIMNVGNMGSKYRMAYTVLGDAVNLGFRLEDLNKKYDVSIILSEFTKKQTTGVVFQELDRVRVTGKVKPVTVYTPLGIDKDIDDAVLEEMDLYTKALEDFRNQKWKDAEMKFRELQSKSAEKVLYTIYLDRIARFMENPPGEGWDAVYSFK